MLTKSTLSPITAKSAAKTFQFYDLDAVTALITDSNISEEKKLELNQYVKVIN